MSALSGFVQSIPSPDPLWRSWTTPEIFGVTFTIHAYAICILIGIIAATLLTNHRLTKRGAEPWIVIDILIFAVPLGIIGARVYHVLTHPGDFFGPDATQTWYAIWEGGIAIFGALIGGAVGAIIGCRLAGIRFWTFADALAPGMLIAQGLGRFGNWFNQELFGLPVSSDYPLALEIDYPNAAWPLGLPTDTMFHPTFLYEMVWNFLGAAALLWLGKKATRQWGKLFALYLVWYGLGRMVFESIRIDPSEIFFGIRVNVWAAIGAVVLGIVIYVVQSRRHTGVEPSPYTIEGERRRAEAAVHSDDAASTAAADTETAGEEAAAGASTATSTTRAAD